MNRGHGYQRHGNQGCGSHGYGRQYNQGWRMQRPQRRQNCQNWNNTIYQRTEKETLKQKALHLWKKAGLPKFLNKYGPKKTPAWQVYLCHLEYTTHAPAWRRASKFMSDYYSKQRHFTTWQKAIQK